MRTDGYTLIEMILVVVIIGILATVAIQSLNKTEKSRRLDETMAEMEEIGRAIAGDERLISDGVRTDFGYVGDIGALPPNLDNLVTNPGGYATWKGPYIQNNFNENNEDYKRDAWDNLYTYTGGITITSNADGTPISMQFAASSADLTANSVKGIVRDRAGLPPSDSASNVSITIFYPDGSGSITSSATTPSRSGEFSIDNQIPIGVHQIRAVVSGVNDTTSKYLAINPGSITMTELRFPSDLWAGSSGGPGVVVYREFSEAKLPFNGNSISIPTPSGTNAGDLLIAAVTTDRNVSISPPGGGGWIQIAQNSSGQVTLGVWFKIAGASEPPSQQFTWSSNQECYAWIMRFTGHDPANPINASAANGGTSSSPSCPSVTAGVSNTMIVRIGGFDNDEVNVDNPGMAGHTPITMDESGSSSGSCSGGAAYKTQTNIGASGTADFTLNNSEQYRTVTVAIAPAP